MNAASFANRLTRDLSVKSLTELTADGRQELCDAINAAIQRLHDLAPDHSKTGLAVIPIDAPQTVTLDVTAGSVDFTGEIFPESSFYRTIRVSGDDIDNQLSGESTFTHPYAGATGTVQAVVYSDAVPLPDTIAEIVSNPQILETGDIVRFAASNPWGSRETRRAIARPEFYWMEPNSRNLNPPAGGVVMRLGSLPDKAYRMECLAVMAPTRIAFTDLLTPQAALPIRPEHVEAYLYPVARAFLTESSLWADKENVSRIAVKGEEAERRYALAVPQYPSTPTHRVRTRRGF
jgi:hypothetical protein